jgi:hypothetical protein
MQNHLRKHLIHGLFLVAIAVAVQASGLAISALGVVVAVVVSLVLLEAGLWVIHRRHATAPS